jgi:hypothetical protein
LLKDVEDGKVDTIVVYKVDRLTRSLADFAKIVEAQPPWLFSESTLPLSSGNRNDFPQLPASHF